MKINDTIHGFKVIKQKTISDINSKLTVFTHEKSGATLAYLESDDTNKVFTCGFRTLAEDSTGVCHIIEHSVLSGSQKYPLKEPFVNLLKGSMATFLNALTANDWTSYPVASQNDKDFDNLIAAYLDSVFAPLSIVDPKAFLQEGWHIEMKDENDMPSIKGVVYNEMKGATSSVEEQVFQETLNAIYEGTGYGVNAGGDPDVIPTLTYEYYKEFYRKHYHPENALMYLYGKMDIEAKLKYIDEEYLSKFEKGGNKVTIEVPKSLVNMNVKKEYACNDEDLNNNTYISLAFALDKYENQKDITAFSILNQALMENNESPLKKAFLEKKLGQDIQSSVNDDCIKPCYVINLQKTNEDKKDEFYNVLIDTCKKLVSEGIDKELLLGTISNNEFRIKEMDMARIPKGLIYYFWLIQNFVYDLPLEKALEYEANYKFYKDNLNNGYFESLLEKYIINSDHKVCVTLVPSRTLEKEKEAEMESKMKALKESMSKEEIMQIVKTTNDLIAYQSKKDTEEELKLLPSLEIEDIPLDINTLTKNIVNKENVKCIEHEFNTNGISYLKMYFDLTTLTIEEIPFVKSLIDLYNVLDTEKYASTDLQNLIKTYLGSLKFDFTPVICENKVTPKFVLAVSALEENTKYIPEIIDQIVNHTIFDEEKINTVLVQELNIEKSMIIQNGMIAAIHQAIRSSSEYGYLVSKTSGKPYVDFLSEAIKDVSATTKKIKEIVGKIFNKENLVISLSGEKKQIDDLYNVFKDIKLSDAKNESKLQLQIDKKESEALVIPSQVNYNAKAINLKELNVAFSGKMLVLAHIIRLDYLWTEIRVKGGAYGCTINFSRNGDVSLGSFRDPNVSNTYEVYNSVYNYLNEFNPSKEEFKSYLIGAVGGFDQPESNNMKIFSNDLRIISGYTDEERIKIKKEMLSTTVEDIKGFAPIFNYISENASSYTIGNETKINEYNKFERKSNL